MLGTVSASARRPRAAHQEFREAIGCVLRPPRRHLSLGQLLQQRGDRAGAAAALTRRPPEPEEGRRSGVDIRGRGRAGARQGRQISPAPSTGSSAPWRSPPRTSKRSTSSPRRSRAWAGAEAARNAPPGGAPARPRTCGSRTPDDGSPLPSCSQPWPRLPRPRLRPAGLCVRRCGAGGGSHGADHLWRSAHEQVPARDDRLRRGDARLRQRRLARSVLRQRHDAGRIPAGTEPTSHLYRNRGNGTFDDVTPGRVWRSPGGARRLRRRLRQRRLRRSLCHVLGAESPVPQSRQRHVRGRHRPRGAVTTTRWGAGCAFVDSTATACSICSPPTTSISI